MTNKYKNLFSPLQIKNMVLKNRIVMSPMGTNFAMSDGQMSDEHIEYYRLRAAGGVGLIIMENVCVDSPTGDNGTTQLRLDHDSFIPKLYKFNETIHRYGCCTSVQINHGGCTARASRTGVTPVAPSPIKLADGTYAHELTVTEIEAIAEKYGEAALRAKIAGFDSIEIHAGHGYLINQFMSPLWNQRTDEFGGSAENRARFCRIVIDKVREKVGEQYPVMMRVSMDDLLPGGNTMEDSLKQLEILQEGVDIFDASVGAKYAMDVPQLPDGWRSYVSRQVKEHFSQPCAVMGNIREPEVAEAILERGDADLIIIGRGLLADPEWVNKVMAGNEACVRPCISCNIGCVAHRIEHDQPIRCAVNPCIASEEWHKKNKVTKECNVLVIGGGISGLEAACTAAETGCRVTLLEESDKLGGWVEKVSQLPLKFRMKRLLNYMLRRAEALKGLTCLTGVKVTPELIEAFKPDVIAWCTGSEPLLPAIPGLKEAVLAKDNNVYDVKGFLSTFPQMAEKPSGKKIAIAGGGWVALDVAEFFAENGNDVTIVELQRDVGLEMDRYNKQHITNILSKSNAAVLTNTALKAVHSNEFVVQPSGGAEETLAFDYGFVCLGLKAKTETSNLKSHFEDCGIPCVTIGDGKRARRIYEGVHEARAIVETIKNLGFYD